MKHGGLQGSPVVETVRFQSRGHGLNPWPGNQDPTCTEPKHQKKKKKKETWILSRSYPGHLSFILGLFVPESLFSTPHRPPSGYSNLIRAPPSTILVFLSPGQLQAEGLKQLKPSIDFSFSPQLLSFLKFPNVFREL